MKATGIVRRIMRMREAHSAAKNKSEVKFTSLLN